MKRQKKISGHRVTEMSDEKHSFKRVIKWIGGIILAILLLDIIAGLIPVSTEDLESNPDPAADYDEATTRFDAIVAAEVQIVNDDGYSLLMTHGEPTEQVYVLIHGITNSPRQWEELGQMLHEQGHNVLIMRMPYHGLKSHKVGELSALSAADLRDYADDALDIAVGLGEEITVIGISGGATVTSWIGQYRPEVTTIIPLSPFMGLPQLPPFMDTFIMNLGHRMPNIVLDKPSEPRRDWVYRGETTHAPAEFMLLGRSVLDRAADSEPLVDAAYFLTTAVDDTADNRYTEKLAALWGRGRTAVSYVQFDASQNVPHNLVDPATDAAIRALIYDKIFEIIETME